MKNAKANPTRRDYALGWQSFFFSYTFWVLALLIAFSSIGLHKSVGGQQEERVKQLIEGTAYSELRTESEPNCGTSGRLVFEYNILGVAKKSCYRKGDDGLLRLYNGFFKCSKTLFPSRTQMEPSDKGRAYQIGGRYICGDQYDLDLDNFEFVDVGDVTSQAGSQRCPNGYKECGATSSKILCVTSSMACPVNEIKVSDSGGSTTGILIFPIFQIFMNM